VLQAVWRFDEARGLEELLRLLSKVELTADKRR
jgi:hypothetical protein